MNDKKEKPIIFSTPMVQAILNTKPGVWPAEPVDETKPYKWMTRRAIKPRYKPDEVGFEVSRGLSGTAIAIIDENGSTTREEPPKYWPGDIILVRETWGINGYNNLSGYEINVDFKAGGSKCCVDLDNEKLWERYIEQETAFCSKHGNDVLKWRSPRFMPREVARIFLEVKNVRIEKLQRITNEDAKAEGVTSIDPFLRDLYIGAFHKLWDTLNARHGYSWDSNPYVYVYEFMRVT